MLALWARYQCLAEGALTNSIHSLTEGDDGPPPDLAAGADLTRPVIALPPWRPVAIATPSQPSYKRRALTARHQGLPGFGPVSGSRSPRLACQRMKESAARR